ncbi:hypothetical protein [Ornithinimicrobium pekingense]|uniref:Dehydrogenase n=1 Tax=Ornithinimicrobium pekingense TaxID=384677 RepID=A0ABQ2F377_9MICO|nr:hypothetical protein [Ornithinimicrobium pekingense]GGK57581.1 dehydrogenase [Ornithinimicrobium pekingense]
MIGVDPWAPGEVPLPVSLTGLLADAADAAGDATRALGLAGRAMSALPLPGEGRTDELWRALAEMGAADLTVARALEPHLDAGAVLAQARAAGHPVPAHEGTWGVFAAEGPGTRLGLADGRLTGTKPWCSLAGELDRALVTAWVSDDERALVAVDLRHPGVTELPGEWVPRGLSTVRSTGLRFADVPAVPVGPSGWYLSRPGFAWGGMGVAAVWLGGAVGLARRLRRSAREREPDQVGQALLGEVDARLVAAAAVLTEAARAVDAGRAAGPDAWPRAVRVRHVVHDACEAVLSAVAHGLGPGPLVTEEGHAARVADLQVYLRQHRGVRDAAVVGAAVAGGMATPW